MRAVLETVTLSITRQAPPRRVRQARRRPRRLDASPTALTSSAGAAPGSLVESGCYRELAPIGAGRRLRRSACPASGSCARSDPTPTRRRPRGRRRRAPARSPTPRPPPAPRRSRPSPRRPPSSAGQHPAGRAAVERQRGAERDDRAQAVGRLERRHAHPHVALPHVELHALARRVAQPLERGPGRSASGRPRPRPGRGRPGAGRGRSGPRRRAAPGRGPRGRRPGGGRWPWAARWRRPARPAAAGPRLERRRGSATALSSTPTPLTLCPRCEITVSR